MRALEIITSFKFKGCSFLQGTKGFLCSTSAPAEQIDSDAKERGDNMTRCIFSLVIAWLISAYGFLGGMAAAQYGYAWGWPLAQFFGVPLIGLAALLFPRVLFETLRRKR